MLLRQLFDHETWTYTYLIADEVTKEAALIDPVVGQMSLYTQLLRELGLTLKYGIDTHVHADHVTALGALRETLGARTIHGAGSQASCVDRFVSNGDVISVGGYQLQAIATPGHTDDSYSFLLEADGKSMVFTGDTLLIRGTGRTDFQNGDAGMQYESLTEKLLTLPDDTIVYPGHDYRGMTKSCIGEEKRFNPRLQVSNKAEYVALMGQLKLADPKFMDVAVPANLECGATYTGEYHI